MARKKGSSKGPRLLRGKLGDKRAKAYLTRGLTRALQKQGKLKKRTRRTKAQMGMMKKGRRGAPGKPKSAAHRKKIAAGVRAAHKRGAYKNVKRRKSSRRRKAA